MRIATYRGSDGKARTGAVTGAEGAERIVDLHDATGGKVPQGDLLALLEAGALDAARGVSGDVVGRTHSALEQAGALKARPPAPGTRHQRGAGR